MLKRTEQAAARTRAPAAKEQESSGAISSRGEPCRSPQRLPAPPPADGRVVRLALTAKGRRRVDALSGAHVEELRELTPILTALVEDASSA
jgi:hypothetical protein